MTRAPASIFKIPTESPQLARGAVSRARKATAKPKSTGLTAGRVAGIGTRAATRGDGEVIELGLGITAYPPRDKGGRWRAVWHEDGERQQCEPVSEDKLAAKLEKVRQRLAMGAANTTKPGADLIAWYLNPDRLPVADRWSRTHADNQRRLCERFAAPVIGAVTCQDITTSHGQKIVNAAPTAGEGDRVHRMLSSMVSVGLKGGYLVKPMLAEVHWQASDRPVPAPEVGVAGNPRCWSTPRRSPYGDDVATLGNALSARRRGERDELMANLAALSIGQVAQAARVNTVDRKVVEVGGRLYVEAPKNRKRRRTIYPRRTPGGFPLAERLAARTEEAHAEQAAGTNPQGLWR
jgi:hypothetical protein